MKKEENNIIVYEDKDGKTKISVRFESEDIWLTQNQLAGIYKTTQQNIQQHINNIYKDEELNENATHKKFLLVQTEGNREVKRDTSHYNLDIIIALGYKVQSSIAVRFRRWATERLHEYIQKGFTMDDERLKQGGNRYFQELLQRIRDIRSSERNFTKRSRIFMQQVWITTHEVKRQKTFLQQFKTNYIMPATSILLPKLYTSEWIMKNLLLV
jgi:hypothetical protein